MSHYETLEVSQNASQEVIKAAYKSLIQRYHPDRNPDNMEAARRSVLIAQAYEVLSDPERRVAYDATLKLQATKIKDVLRSDRGDTSSRSSSGAKNGTYWISVVAAALSAWLLWQMLIPSENKLPTDTKPETSSLLFEGNKMGDQQYAATPSHHATSRTIPSYVTNLKVVLDTPRNSAENAQEYRRLILSIDIIDIVVGSFDPDKFISFMKDNKEYIVSKLAQRLASASYDHLVSSDRNYYIKRIILDSFGEITNTNRFENSAKPEMQYGVVDVALPLSFSIKPENASIQPEPVLNEAKPADAGGSAMQLPSPSATAR